MVHMKQKNQRLNNILVTELDIGTILTLINYPDSINQSIT